MNPPVELDLLLRVPYVEPFLGYAISPDGSQLAFSWNPTGRWEIYLLDLVGNSPPTRITQGKGGKFAPHWSPDGSQLVYLVDYDGSEAYDLFLYSLSTQTTINLIPDTPWPLGTVLSWSPDGSSIAFCADMDGCFNVYVLTLADSKIRKVFDHSNPDWEVDWSPDGKWLAVVSSGDGQDYWTHLVSMVGAEVIPLALEGKNICAKGAVWSPDSAQIAFSSNILGDYQIGLFALESRTFFWLTEGHGRKERSAWAPDGSKIAYVVNDGPKTQFFIYHVEDSSHVCYDSEPGVIYAPKFTPDSQNIIYIFDNPRNPDDLWKLNLASGEYEQLTHSLPAEICADSLADPHEVEYPGLDGEIVPALLYLPADLAAPFPAVIYVHGGPNWLSQITWDPLVQHMVSRGWAVLAPNYRGSTGYGKEWQLANRFDLGGGDTEDVVAGAYYLIEQGLALEEKIAVTGRSWGGYLTMTCLTQYPDLWAGGSAVVPFLNWFTAHENSREDLQHWDRENFGDPEENYDLWYERSPYFFLDRVQAPVQFICGANDIRCPASESEQAYQILIEQGKEADYVLYPDEGHTLLKIENQIDAKKRRVDFLASLLE